MPGVSTKLYKSAIELDRLRKESHRGLGVKHLGMLFTGLNLKEKSRDHLLK